MVHGFATQCLPPRRFTSWYAKAVVRCMEIFIKHNVRKSKPRIIWIINVVQGVGRCPRIRGGQYLWDVRSQGRVYFQFHSCCGRSLLERSNELCVLLWNNLHLSAFDICTIYTDNISSNTYLILKIFVVLCGKNHAYLREWLQADPSWKNEDC